MNTHRNRSSSVWRWGMTLCALALWQGDAMAQSPARFYVDPVQGNNGNAGSIQAPFETITHAMTVAGGAAPSIVVLHPGIYSAAETYPIFVPEGVSIQGTNALNTVLFVDDRLADGLVYATTPHAGCFVDGIMIAGADEGLRIEAVQDPKFVVSESVSPTISNCAFMNNIFGVSLVTDSFVLETYPVCHQPKIVNCTMTGNDYGIVDWVFGAAGTGPSKPAIINTLSIGNMTTDIEGIDDQDAVQLVFEKADMGTFSTTMGGLPTSAAPTASFTISTCFLSAEDFQAPPGAVQSYDFRLDPTDVFAQSLIDLGSLGLQAPNGTTYQLQGPGRMFTRDFDAEGFGNARVCGGLPDIGADEIGTLIVSGYLPQTTRLDPQVSPPVLFFNAGAPGVPTVVKGFGRQSNPVDFLTTLIFGGTPGGGPGLVIGGTDGLRGKGTTLGIPFVGVSGIQYAQMQSGFMGGSTLFNPGLVVTTGPGTISIQPPTLIGAVDQFDMQLTYGTLVGGQIPNPIFTNLQSFEVN